MIEPWLETRLTGTLKTCKMLCPLAGSNKKTGGCWEWPDLWNNTGRNVTSMSKKSIPQTPKMKTHCTMYIYKNIIYIGADWLIVHSAAISIKPPSCPTGLEISWGKVHKRQAPGLVATWFGMHLDMQNMVLVVAVDHPGTSIYICVSSTQRPYLHVEPLPRNWSSSHNVYE